MKRYEFQQKIYSSVFLRAQLTIGSIGSDDGLALARRQAIVWTNAG